MIIERKNSLISPNVKKLFSKNVIFCLRLLYTTTIFSQKTTEAGVYEKSPVSR